MALKYLGLMNELLMWRRQIGEAGITEFIPETMLLGSSGVVVG